MKSKSLVFLALLFLACCFCGRHAFGQTANLSGTVADSSHAVIPNASVTIWNESTGIRRVTQTDHSGYYGVPYLSPGKYRVTIQTAGFMAATRAGINLVVDQSARLDFTMRAAGESTSVEVTADGSMINGFDPSQSTTTDQKFIDSMPLNGRTWNSLIQLTPGVVALTTGNTFSVNGQRDSSNAYYVDGVSANIGSSFGATLDAHISGSYSAVTATGTTQSLGSVDELEQFTVQTSTYGAKYGSQPGGQVSFATKSGSNKFHGSAFDYVRNNIFDANDWFANHTTPETPRAELRQNDFGGTLGGPLFKKTFFFTSFESTPLRTPYISSTSVPSAAVRTAALPAIQAVYNAFPTGTGAISASSGGQAVTLSISKPASMNAESLRLDHTFGDKLNLFARYHRSPSSEQFPGTGYVAALKANVQTWTGGATWAISPRIINEFRYNYSRNAAGQTYAQESIAGSVPAAESAFLPPTYTDQTAVSTIVATDGGYASINIGRYAGNIQRQFNITDDVTITHGKHEFSAGIDARDLRPVFSGEPLILGIQIENSSTVAKTSGGTTYQPGQSLVSAASRSPGTLTIPTFSAYAQDSWKTTNRLTLTYGVRWELVPPPQAVNGPALLAPLNYDPTNITETSFAPSGTPLWSTTYGNFAPRIGFNYMVYQNAGWETALKGGFGMYYDLGVGNSPQLLSSPPYYRSGLNQQAIYPALLSNTAYTTPPAYKTTGYLSTDPTNATVNFFDTALKLPYTFQYSFALEQGLGHDQKLSIAYVGSNANRLLRGQTVTDTNTPTKNPLNAATVNYTTNLGSANYHSLQLQFIKRTSNHMQARFNYTWAKSLDVNSSDVSSLAPGAVLNSSLNYGRSDFDVRHNFSAALVYTSPGVGARIWEKALTGGWSIAPLYSARSGLPIDITYSATLSSGSYALRPDVVAGQTAWISAPTQPGGKVLNKAAFSETTPLHQGNLSRNTLNGFGFYQLDASIRREFHLRDKASLEFAGEFFNVTNHPNFALPASSTNLGSFIGTTFYSNSTFGISPYMLGNPGAGTSFNNLNALYLMGHQRDLQLDAKFRF